MRVSSSVIVSIILNVIAFGILIYIILFLRKPNFIKNRLIKVLSLNINDYTNNPNVELFPHTDTETKITKQIAKYSTENNLKTRVIVDIPGGAFIDANPNLTPFINMNLSYDVFSLEYPVLFDYTFEDSLKYLSNTLTFILDKIETEYPNAKITLFGHSAGAYFSALLINKFAARIDSFITINGYFGKSTISNEVLKVLDGVYLTSITKKPKYEVAALSNNVDLFIVTSTNDFLKESSEYYAALNGIKAHVYTGGHGFFYISEYGQLAYSDIKSFLDSL